MTTEREIKTAIRRYDECMDETEDFEASMLAAIEGAAKVREPDYWFIVNEFECNAHDLSEVMWAEPNLTITEVQGYYYTPRKYAFNYEDEEGEYLTAVFDTREEAEKAIKEHQQILPEVPHD